MKGMDSKACVWPKCLRNWVKIRKVSLATGLSTCAPMARGRGPHTVEAGEASEHGSCSRRAQCGPSLFTKVLYQIISLWVLAA